MSEGVGVTDNLECVCVCAMVSLMVVLLLLVGSVMVRHVVVIIPSLQYKLLVSDKP